MITGRIDSYSYLEFVEFPHPNLRSISQVYREEKLFKRPFSVSVIHGIRLTRKTLQVLEKI